MCASCSSTAVQGDNECNTCTNQSWVFTRCVTSTLRNFSYNWAMSKMVWELWKLWKCPKMGCYFRLADCLLSKLGKCLVSRPCVNSVATQKKYYSYILHPLIFLPYRDESLCDNSSLHWYLPAWRQLLSEMMWHIVRQKPTDVSQALTAPLSGWWVSPSFPYVFYPSLAFGDLNCWSHVSSYKGSFFPLIPQCMFDKFYIFFIFSIFSMFYYISFLNSLL
jgi:hypothetical protein